MIGEEIQCSLIRKEYRKPTSFLLEDSELRDRLYKLTATPEARAAHVYTYFGPVLDTHTGGIIEIYETQAAPIMNGLAMLHEQGEALKELFSHNREEFWSLFQPVVDCLTYFHKNGWVHRDVKPSNFLFDHRIGAFRLTDYETTRPIDDKYPIWGRTDRYAPAEQYDRCNPPYPSSDTFGLAISLAEMLVAVHNPNSPAINHSILDYSHGAGSFPTFNSRFDLEMNHLLVQNGTILPGLLDEVQMYGGEDIAQVIAAATALAPEDRLSLSDFWHNLTVASLVTENFF